MSRKKKATDWSKNQALRDVLELEKSQIALAEKMGLSKQSIWIVKEDRQAISDTMILYIKKNHPDIAIKYWKDEMIFEPSNKVLEPNYQYKLISKKMERFESELKLLIDLTQELRSEVKQLKDDVEKLKSDSQQSPKAG